MKKLKNALIQLKCPTKICKICFKEISLNSFRTIAYKNISICDSCFVKFNPSFIHYKIDGVKGIALYHYDENMKSLLYQFKGCYDYEFFNVFLEQYRLYFRFIYRNYYIVPIPSSKVDDIRREYNHVEEAFKILDLPMLKILYKDKLYKQSDQKAKDRYKINKILKMSDLESVKNKNILLVDDVSTTGNSLKAAIKLIRLGHPKKIRILTLAKVDFH